MSDIDKPRLPHSHVERRHAVDALRYLREIYPTATEAEIVQFAKLEGLVAFAHFEQKMRGEQPAYPWPVRLRARVVGRRMISRAERERIACAE